MNHYPHHIGDFDSETLHLTFVERALYRELRDLYFKTERALMTDVQKLARRVRATTEELRAALDGLLEEFFVLQDDGWHNDYCDVQIAAYRQKQEQQSAAGKASGVARSKSKDPAEKGSAGSGSSRTRVMPPLDECQPDGATPVERPLNDRSTNQNQNQNQNQTNTPQPPAGGEGDGLAIASELQSYFPEQRRTRLADVARMVDDLVAAGKVSAQDLLTAAAKQSATLGKDDGKACPAVIRWLRESRWLDTQAAPASGSGVPSDWTNSRSGVEAMGERLGLGPWDQERDRLFGDYEARVMRILGQKQPVQS